MRHPVAKGQPRVGRPAHLGSITSRVGGGGRGGGEEGRVLAGQWQLQGGKA